MPLILPDLDVTTRRIMLGEFESDVASDLVYISARAHPVTGGAYIDAKRAASCGGDADSLSGALAGSGIFPTVRTLGKPSTSLPQEPWKFSV